MTELTNHFKPLKCPNLRGLSIFMTFIEKPMNILKLVEFGCFVSKEWAQLYVWILKNFMFSFSFIYNFKSFWGLECWIIYQLCDINGNFKHLAIFEFNASLSSFHVLNSFVMIESCSRLDLKALLEILNSKINFEILKLERYQKCQLLKIDCRVFQLLNLKIIKSSILFNNRHFYYKTFQYLQSYRLFDHQKTLSHLNISKLLE